MNHKKLIAVGDDAVGKTSLLISYASNVFPGEYIPMVAVDCSKNVLLDRKPYCIYLWDTVGQEEYDEKRPLSYPNTDVTLICFAVDNVMSFENITKKWIPELELHIPGVSKLVVCCKADLRKSEIVDCIPEAKGQALADKYGVPYCETSALTHEGVQMCFETAIRTCEKRKTKGCIVI